MSVNPFDQFDSGTAAQQNAFDQFDAGMTQPNPKQNKGTAGDLATSVKRGVLGLPGIVTGLADLAPALGFGLRPFDAAAKYAGEVTGFQPGKWSDEAQKEYSPSYLQAQENIKPALDQTKKELDEAQGFSATLGAGLRGMGAIGQKYIENPSAIGNIVAEALPQVAAGGVISKGLMGVGKVASMGEPALAGAAGFLERKLGLETAAAVAGGAGEGLMQAGSALSESKGEDQRKNAVAALSSGLLDAVIGAGSGKVVQAMGLDTLETAMAKGFNKSVTGELSGKAAALSKTGKILGGGASEGILQELPQSAQETVFQNYAEGKPLWENVPRSAVEGLLAGFVMGSGANALPATTVKPDPKTDSSQSQLLSKLTGQDVTVTGGTASYTSPDGEVFNVPVASLADHFATGGTLDTLDSAVVSAPKLEALKGTLSYQEIADLRNSDELLLEAGVSRRDVDNLLISQVRGTPGAEPLVRSMLETGTVDAQLIDRIKSGEYEPDPLGEEWARQTELAKATNAAALKRLNETEQRAKAEQDLISYWQQQGMVESPEEGAQEFARWNEERKLNNQPPLEAEWQQQKDKAMATNRAMLQRINNVEQRAKAEQDVVSYWQQQGMVESPEEGRAIIKSWEAAVQPPAQPDWEMQTDQATQRNTAAQQRLNMRDIWAQRNAEMDTLVRQYENENLQVPGAPQQTAAPVGTPPAGSPPPSLSDTSPAGAAPLWKQAGLDTKAPITLDQVQAKKQTDGSYKLVYRGTENEIFTGQTFKSAPEARAVFKREQTLAQQTANAPDTLFANDSQTPNNETQTPLSRTGETQTDQLTTALKSFIGDRAVDNLIRKGKIEIVSDVSQVPNTAKLDARQRRSVLGAYNSGQGKVFLVAGNLDPARVPEIMRHEVVHALLREDSRFMLRREGILKSFNALAKNNTSVQAALAKVPAGTAESIRLEEGLAYWVQQESNHKHSLFKRIISAVKSGLARLGIPVGKYSTTDLSRMFTGGMEAWVNQGMEEQAPVMQTETQFALDKPNTLFTMANTSLGNAEKSLTQKIKDFASDKTLDNAPRWLSIAPLHTLVQTLGKKIPQIKQLSRHLEESEYISNDLINQAFDYYQNVGKLGPQVTESINKVALTASFYRVNPMAPMLEQGWVPQDKKTKEDKLKGAQQKWVNSGMDKSTGKSYIAAYTEAKNAYAAINSKEGKDLYENMVGFMSTVREREKNNLLAYIEQSTVGNQPLREQLMQRFNATFKDISGAYWPLNRIGDYRMELTDIDGVQVVQHYESASARRADKEMYIKNGVDKATIKESLKDRRPRGEVAIPMELMTQLSASVYTQKLSEVDPNDQGAVTEARNAAQDVVDEMNQIWLRWQPETSALKNSMQRKNVKGADEDMMRSFLDYTRKHASNIAWAEQGRKIESTVKDLSETIVAERKAGDDPTFKGYVLTEMRNRLQSIRDAKTGPIASTIGKLGTAWYMTSPSIALVQMTQLPILTFPKLAVKYKSIGKAFAAMKNGTQAAFSKDFSKKEIFGDDIVNTLHEQLRETVNEENRVSPDSKLKARTDGKMLGERLYDDDYIEAQFNKLKPKQQKLFVLREALARNLLDISAAHEAYALTQGKNPNGIVNKAFNLAMQPMKISEMASRKAAILATMELAQGQGKSFKRIMNNVSEVVNDTLYSYSKANKPAVLQGGTARVLAMFQWYRIMTVLRMGMLAKQSFAAETPEIKAAARKEFIGIMGMTTMLAGTLGLPLMKQVFAALDALADDDEPRDSELEFRKWAEENLGATWGDVFTHGLPTLAGINISKRVGLGDLYGSQSQPPPRLHGKELAAWWAANQLGPAFGIVQGGFQGYDLMSKGEYLKGLEAALPKPLKDGLRAARVMQEGDVKSLTGRRTLAESEMTADAIPLLALGLNPAEIAQASKEGMSRSRISTAISERRGRVIDVMVKALEGNGDMEKARETLVTYNRKLPRFAVTGGDIRSALIRKMKEDRGIESRRDQLISSQYGL